MKIELKDILIIILITFIGYFLVFGGKKGKNTHSSSLIIEEIHDTFIKYDTIVLKQLISVGVNTTKKDTVLDSASYILKEFRYEVNDSLLNGTLFVTSVIKPEVNFKYLVKSFKIKDSTITKPQTNYSGLLYGLSLAAKPFGTELYLDFAKSFKNGNQINMSLGRHFETKQTVFKVGILKKF